MILPARSRLTGIFGLISQVRKSLKPAWAVMVCNFFSKVTSQEGARWTFFSKTNGNRSDRLSKLSSQVVNPARSVVARHTAHEDGGGRLDLSFDDHTQVHLTLGSPDKISAEGGGHEFHGSRREPICPKCLDG